ncbi:alpha/beta fold hydrolase [Psychrobacter sp. FDAARGOS_221]|uniref:alpha/beta hydrolase family protein n=1 Tax=Psychrobacter sp. FDAARGOS_221 TaxID=1975705 RepID=UPI000BB53846|nr:alpha/beta fold hydrolase [Psychrobacter sp. FDAARGOS_221]PNK61265.1 alpha/beta hydrolase [Psychrobacter sp. FDAARGOS_221]
MTHNTSTLTIITERNQPLTASIYTPTGKGHDDIKDAIMIAPATGIKRLFYKSFASYLASQGFGVITYDNEGIGDSLTCPLPKCDASLISWGRHDATAVLEALQDEFPNANYHLVGHSAGGQLIGLMPNYQALSSVVNVACSSGRIKNMDMPFKAQAMVFMDGAITLGNLLLGYTPSDKFDMGEPLPRGVAKQWRDWCNGKGYIKTAFGKTVFTHYYDEFAAPSLWLNFTDDDIANAKNVDDMLAVFTAMPAEKRMMTPQQFGLKHIGHMKFFSSKTHAKAPELWQMATDWIQAHSK